jgi:hypothetical protein
MFEAIIMQDSFKYEDKPGHHARYRLDGKFIDREEYDGHSWQYADRIEGGTPAGARIIFEDFKKDATGRGLLRP